MMVSSSLVVPRLFEENRILTVTVLFFEFKGFFPLQLAVCGFVCNKFSKKTDLLRLKWLPIPEKRIFNLLKIVFKAIHQENWPNLWKQILICETLMKDWKYNIPWYQGHYKMKRINILTIYRCQWETVIRLINFVISPRVTCLIKRTHVFLNNYK